MIFTRPRGKRDYILIRERELATDAQTIFELDDLRERDRVRIMDSFKVSLASEGDTAGSIGGGGTRIYLSLKSGLKGWRNALYPDGTAVPFVTESGSKQPSDETLALLDAEAKNELAGEIMSQAFPDEDDKEK
tara:strand:+ start:39012 stop:39410 length:399 start_codon:yes stop_codon:yes gene_type:complete